MDIGASRGSVPRINRARDKRPGRMCASDETRQAGYGSSDRQIGWIIFTVSEPMNGQAHRKHDRTDKGGTHD